MNLILNSEEDRQYLIEPFHKNLPYDIVYPCLAVGHWDTDYNGAEGFVYHFVPLTQAVDGKYIVDPDFINAFE